MSKYFVVHAFEGIHNGLHGIEAWNLLTEDEEEYATEVGSEMSIDLMYDHPEIIRGFQKDAIDEGLNPGSYEFDNYVEQAIDNNIEMVIYPTRETSVSLDDLCEKLAKDPTKFVREFCEED